MQSHTCDFKTIDVVRILAPALAPVALFACLMHFGARADLLPKPRPTLDVDRTILVHKAEASRSRHDAQILLIGDSSCMINVAACEIGLPALNLGTLSYLSLESHATLLREYFAVNTGRVHTVVLLMHPEALRLGTPGEYHAAVLSHFLRGEDYAIRSSVRDHVSYWLGFDFFRNRLLARSLPIPLSGAYGRRYGFTSDLEHSLDANCGSLVDPDPRKFQGNPEYRLAPQLEKASAAFRAAIPPSAQLLVAITPIPAGYAPRGYAQTHARLLARWQQYLQPVTMLTNLPPTMTDHLFVSITHLSEAGARQYTSHLAEILRQDRDRQ
jgi:hypothetical protein